MKDPIQQTAYGQLVWVAPELENIRRDACLCYRCDRFKPSTTDNCEIAQSLYSICVKFNVATPVARCPKFIRKANL